LERADEMKLRVVQFCQMRRFLLKLLYAVFSEETLASRMCFQDDLDRMHLADSHQGDLAFTPLDAAAGVCDLLLQASQIGCNGHTPDPIFLQDTWVAQADVQKIQAELVSLPRNVCIIFEYLDSMDLLQTCRELFAEALHGLNIAQAMQNRIVCEGDRIRAGEQEYLLRDFRRILVISIGKAAVPMAAALLSQIETMRSGNHVLEGIVVGPSAPQLLDTRLQFFQGDHPWPSVNSRIAAEKILELLASCDEGCLVFFLISGGASAMVEMALEERYTLNDVADLHRALVHSGLPIGTMNVLRKHFSRVKGGRLAVAGAPATQCTILISDVPENALDIVGSGPSLPDTSTVADCREILRSSHGSLDLPSRLAEFFLDPSLPETPKRDHPAFQRSHVLSLLSSDDLCAVAARSARARGFYVVIDHSCDEWDYRDAAKHLLDRLEGLRKEHASVCLLSAGEVSVQIAAKHGTGGRNQQFVLECARLLAERGLRATVLSGGSDGVDGNSPAAGAMGDETTVARAAACGLDVAAALEQFDSAKIFAALNDAIITGPTGNNVRDLRILLITA